MSNPLCYHEISIAGKPEGRIVYELYMDANPKTAENFRALCTGEKDDVGGVRLWYKNTPFHQVAKGSYMMGGDITTRNGHGGRSIYGQHFPQENFKLKHVGPGILGCVAHGPNIQSSQFYVTTQKMSQLDGKLVVFGRVVEGMDIVKKIECLASPLGQAPTKMVMITECGQVGT